MLKKFKIYVAGSWQNKNKIRKWMDQLEQLGLEIAMDWTDHELKDDFRKYAEDDIIGLLKCDLFVIDCELRNTGKIFEFGFITALQRLHNMHNARAYYKFLPDKRIYAIKAPINKENGMTTTFRAVIPDYNYFDNFEKFLEFLKQVLQQLKKTPHSNYRYGGKKVIFDIFRQCEEKRNDLLLL